MVLVNFVELRVHYILFFVLTEFSGYTFLFFCIVEFANNYDSIGEMSLLWRKKCAEPCSKCNDESTDTDLTCDFCGKVCIV